MAAKTFLQGVIAVLLLGSLLPGCRSARSDLPDQAFLVRAWAAYKETFIRPEGYVWDQRREEVTSEGQSYALLQAVWMRDQETFSRVFAWTEAQLARPDGLYAWQWTPKDGGHVTDANTATDADQDIAFALILAGRAFGNEAYLERARRLLTAIRRHEGIPLDGGWIPCAGNWAVAERIINFSYFTFYAYPVFAVIDPQGDWLGVRERAYDLLTRFLSRPGVLLPSDFAIVTATGAFLPVSGRGRLSDAFSFDAMRVYWRVALDCLRNHFPRACSDPARIRNIMDILSRDGTLYARYSVSGEKKSALTSISFLGSILPAIGLQNKPLAQAIAAQNLSVSKLTAIMRDPDHYYDNNWTWFGIAAWLGSLSD